MVLAVSGGGGEVAAAAAAAAFVCVNAWRKMCEDGSIREEYRIEVAE